MLDTDLSIYVINRRPVAALNSFNAHAGEICISAITLAELLHGVEKSGNPTRTLRRVDDFTSRLSVLEYGERAAAHYGEIKSDLERTGLVIGPNDLHIAGHARSEALTLVTNNQREFDRVEGLRTDCWVERPASP
jgi:tRNA(fMet)-specific endonuclease VapC